MGFPVFAYELRGADPTEIDGFDFVQQTPYLIANTAVGGLDLPLRKSLQEAAAGLAEGARMGIDTLEEQIGN